MNALSVTGLVFLNLHPIINALGVLRIILFVSLKNLVSIILHLCNIFYSTQLNHFFLPFFVQNKVAVMICCLNMMTLSLKMTELYFQLLPVQQISKVIVFTAAPCHAWHPGPDATLLII
jgi:hypothetical protein